MIEKILGFLYPKFKSRKDDSMDQFVYDPNHSNMYDLFKNKTVVKRFVIPVNGLTREQAEEQVHKLMRDYRDDVKWDESTPLSGNTIDPHELRLH